MGVQWQKILHLLQAKNHPQETSCLAQKNPFIRCWSSQSNNWRVQVFSIQGNGICINPIQQKIIHDFGKVAHIEDIVINDKFRGMGIGKQLLEFLNTEARNIGCYKSILNCKDELIPFYNKCQPKNSEIKLSNQISFYFNWTFLF